jgi:hypothetical protein
MSRFSSLGSLPVQILFLVMCSRSKLGDLQRFRPSYKLVSSRSREENTVARH